MPWQHDTIFRHSHADGGERQSDERLSEGIDCRCREIDVPHGIRPCSIGQVSQILPIVDPTDVEWVFSHSIHDHGPAHATGSIDDPDFTANSELALDESNLQRIWGESWRPDIHIRR